MLFQDVDFVGQGSDLREFERSGLFTPCSSELEESANKRREAGLMVFTVKPCPAPSLKRGLNREFKEANVGSGLKTHTPNNIAVSDTRLIFQEKIVPE
jgi:hypothetical protein